jgi:lipid-binding SYLF domain-containing protein
MGRTRPWMSLALATLILHIAPAVADKYDDTILLFKDAAKSAPYFASSYGYAVFPTIGKGGLGVGAAHGAGRVYQQGRYVGDASMMQISIGFQAGGQSFSQIIFFQNRRALDEFTSGHFAFDATAGAVAITAGGYHKGMAVFKIVKDGTMYQATVGGQKFSYKPKPR